MTNKFLSLLDEEQQELRKQPHFVFSSRPYQNKWETIKPEYCDQPVPTAELDDAKRSMTASFALSLENPGEVLNLYVLRQMYGYPPDHWDLGGVRCQLGREPGTAGLARCEGVAHPVASLRAWSVDAIHRWTVPRPRWRWW